MNIEEQLRNDAEQWRSVGNFNIAQVMTAAADKIDALQARVKRLEESGDILESDKRALKAILSDLGVVGSMGFGSTLKWIAAKESKP